MSIIEDGPNGEKFVRMAYMAAAASHTVNGVAAIHSDIIKNTIFKDFADLFPGAGRMALCSALLLPHAR